MGAAEGGGPVTSAAEEFAEFYRGTYSRTLACAFALTGDLGDAQEAAQEAYLRAWVRWTRLSSYDDPAAWVRHVAVRVAVSRWRRARNALMAWTRHGAAPALNPPGPDAVALAEALAELPEPQRRALVLHHLADLPVAEVARREGVPEGTAKARLARGRRALATALDDSQDPQKLREVPRG